MYYVIEVCYTVMQEKDSVNIINFKSVCSPWAKGTKFIRKAFPLYIKVFRKFATSIL